MTLIVSVAALMVVAVLSGFGFVFLRLSRGGRLTQVDPAWLTAFSPKRYRPMERLLAGEDFAFLAAQPGYTRDLGRRLRSERRRIFRAYLRFLVRDFERLHRAARVLLLTAPEDRPDYAAALVRQRLVFERTMFVVRWRLLLNWAAGSTVDVSGLVGALEALNGQVRALATAPAAA